MFVATQPHGQENLGGGEPNYGAGHNRVAGLSVRTRQQTLDQYVAADEDATFKSNRQLAALTKELSSEVYDSQTIQIIESTRNILDLPNLAKNINENGSSFIKVAITSFPVFYESVRKIPVRSLNDVSEEELSKQYKEFLKSFGEISKSLVVSEELNGIDPKVLIKKFFDPKGELYEGIEMVLQAIAVASVKHS